MKPSAAARIRKEETRERRRAAERFRRWLEDLRRRQQQADRDRRRKWLIALLLALLDSRPVQMFFPVHFAEADPPQQKRQLKPSRNSEERSETVDTRTDDERRFLYDYAPRYGEESQEVYDGLTWNDIVAYNKIHRPHLFPRFVPIPGMPARYSSEPVHVWTLLFEMQYPHARRDAIAALKFIVDPASHDWITACASLDDGWKDLKKCWMRTPDLTVYEFPRAAARWREELRRDAEEKKRDAKETPTSGPKPPGVD
ncbi:hypothetical protein [Rhizobium sp. WW_1]|uniref:hypothetical protein n=1 Tax=Rhizobium sp. WW_1 TaxID=1907375 RepID=UPI0006460D02|nr:hypothetical protein [Rhizobium sp. WW_1]RKD55746.1 hypothetical protein BJ928_112155 [Rhizobium sp. WW_1]